MHGREDVAGSGHTVRRFYDGIKIGASYKAGKESIEAIENFISKNSETSEERQKTYKESIAWYAGITADIFG